ncbi:MAG: LysM peptidoglycan-binding domain-containing protein [Actinobacteria bacterium]|nr:MAG: LysM peptidoglycan-binding domain-containing protein [Actinomycetota bacterium]
MPALVPFVTTLVFAAALHAGGDGYTVGRGDTLSGIAERTGVSTAELARANAITDPNLIVAGQVLDVPQPAAPAQPSTYTVRAADTLTAIAAGLGVSSAELARANGITDPNRILVGQVLDVPGGAATRQISAYSRLGTWVDVYDYVPAFGSGAGVPQLSPTSVAAMAAAGIRTLYLQAAVDSPRASGILEAPDLLGAFLTRAHAVGMQVVAWYVPTFSDLDADLQHLRAMRDFRVSGQGFDGLAVDIEWTAGVPDTSRRNAALVELSRRLRAETGTAIGAIVLPPVLLEVVNQNYWPRFPWQALAPYYDVWLPMAYWTDRTTESGYSDPARYTTENIARIRTDLGQPKAAVHVIGGIGGSSTAAQYRQFVTAARGGGAVGISLYDFRATSPSVWSILARK